MCQTAVTLMAKVSFQTSSDVVSAVPAGHDAGVIEQDVDAAKFGESSARRRGNNRRLGNDRLRQMCSVHPVPEFCFSTTLTQLETASRNDQVGAFLRKQKRGRFPNPGGGAGR